MENPYETSRVVPGPPRSDPPAGTARAIFLVVAMALAAMACWFLSLRGIWISLPNWLQDGPPEQSAYFTGASLSGVAALLMGFRVLLGPTWRRGRPSQFSVLVVVGMCCTAVPVALAVFGLLGRAWS